MGVNECVNLCVYHMAHQLYRYIAVLEFYNSPDLSSFSFAQALPHLECTGPSFDPIWTELRKMSIAHREVWGCS